MRDHTKEEHSRKSLRKSQTVRYCVSTRTASLFLLLLIFLLCLWYRGSYPNEKQEVYPFPIKYQQQANWTATLNVFPQLEGTSIEQQIEQHCLDSKCQSQQLKVLYLISNMMKQQIATEYIVPNYIIPNKDKENKVLPPLIIEADQDKPKNIESLVEYILTAAEHQQLTTPLSKRTYLQSLFDIFNTYKPYQEINCLFQNCSVLWQPKIQNALITVQAEQKIRPNLIEIESKADAITKMEVIGLVVSPTNQLLGLHLGNFQLKPGINWLHCKKSHCLQQYSMVLFKIGTMKLSRLKIYRKMVF